MLTPEISIPIYAQIPSGILIFAIGLYSWLKIKKKENFIFFLLAITQTVFAYGAVALFYSCGNDSLTMFIDRIFLYPFCIMMPILVYHFSFEFCGIKAKWQKFALYGGYVWSVVLVVWSQFDSFISGAYHYRWGCHTQARFGNHFYVALIIIYVLLAIYNLYKVWRDKNVDALKRGQAVYIMIGFFIFSLAGFTLLWAYGYGIYPLSYLALPLFIIVIAYAITRYRLMDISFIFRQSTIYLITISLFLLGLYLVIIVSAWYLKIAVHWNLVTAAFFASVLMLVMFDRTRDFIAKIANRYFFSEAVDYQEVTNDLTKQLAKEIDLKKSLQIIKDALVKKMKLGGVKIILFDKKIPVTESLEKVGFNSGTSGFLIKYYFNEKGMAVEQELNFILDTTKDKEKKGQLERLREDMKKIKVSICLPLVVGEEHIGLIFLGDKPSASAYTKEDLEALSILESQASIAIANAMLYQEVRDYSLNLKKKVSEQTKDIREKNENLKKLLEMRSEFLNITSHQLRTPVSVIKGTLSMLIEGRLPEKDQKHLLETAYDKAKKLTDIVNDILLASEMKSDKFNVEMERVQLKDVVQEVYDDKVEDAKNKGIELKLDLPNATISDVLSNTKYLKQVIYNLINNALQYTLNGSITVQVEEKTKTVLLRVIDTGIGIPKESLPKLFQRFSRAPNAVATFTDGSGLGLFIIKEIIDSHKGAKVYVESTELGKGTTFTIELPKTKSI